MHSIFKTHIITNLLLFIKLVKPTISEDGPYPENPKNLNQTGGFSPESYQLEYRDYSEKILSELKTQDLLIKSILSKIDAEENQKWELFDQTWNEAVRPTIIWPYAGTDYCFNSVIKSNVLIKSDEVKFLNSLKFGDCEKRKYQAIFENNKIVITHKNCVVKRKTGCKIKKCLTLVEKENINESSKKHTKVSDDEIYSGASDIKDFDDLTFLKSGFKRSINFNKRKLLTQISLPFEIEVPETQISAPITQASPRVARSAATSADEKMNSNFFKNMDEPTVFDNFEPTLHICQDDNHLQNFSYNHQTGQLQLDSNKSICLGMKIKRQNFILTVTKCETGAGKTDFTSFGRKL